MDHAGCPGSIPEAPAAEMAPLIRFFEQKDFDAVCCLERGRSGSSYGSAVFIRQASVIFSPFFFVADQRGEVVGYGIGALDQGDMEEGWILRLKVDEYLRSRGIGHLLLDRVVCSLIDAGAARILLSVAPDNNKAIRLYVRYGFSKIHTLTCYFGDGEDRIIMQLETDWCPGLEREGNYL
jgi:ribosomal-protein-alanine N-acetyltransferase